MPFAGISSKVQQLAHRIIVADDYYQNIPESIQPYPIEPEEDNKDNTGLGPPSLYDNHGDSKWKSDIRRQGPRPVRDTLIKDREFINIDPGQPIEDEQGIAPDNTTTKGRDDDSRQRETCPVDVDEITRDDLEI